jgi:hypothetical protein
MCIPVAVEGRIGAKLRKLLNGQGFSKVKLVGYEVRCGIIVLDLTKSLNLHSTTGTMLVTIRLNWYDTFCVIFFFVTSMADARRR